MRRSRGPIHALSVALGGGRSYYLSIALLVAGCGGRPTDPARPDVLLVTLDTLRADHVGVYGAPEGATPHLDALAAGAVVFERALAASSRTAPAHASLFTSRWVRDHAIGYRNGATRLGDEPTLAAILATAGYETAAFVSNTMLRRRVGLDRGFATFDDTLPDGEPNRAVFERVAEKTTARAVAYLAGSRRAPLFLWVQYNDPHGPYTPPAGHLGGAAPPADADTPLPALDSQRGERGIPAYQVFGDERRPSQYRARYAAEIRYLDASFGRLLAAFEDATRGRGSIVAVMADHGESLGEEDFYFSHGFATTPNLAHVPFLLRAPGLPPGRVATPIHHVDLLPTLLELVGVPVPGDAAGIALGPMLRGEEPPPGDRALFVDVGAEVSVYRGDVFLRTRTGETLGPAAQGSRQAYRWQTASAWQPVATPEDLEREAQAYSAVERAPLRSAPELERDDEERLRALGYLEPETRSR